MIRVISIHLPRRMMCSSRSSRAYWALGRGLNAVYPCINREIRMVCHQHDPETVVSSITSSNGRTQGVADQRAPVGKLT